ncbi:MAG: AAA family ATPase [Deltaproteobacteria bacterium]|nr:AAA family ATPase [Deltaproteobacteria bacterium]
MYAAHFGLTAEPFSLTPDPAFFYLSPDHAEALAGLKIGLESRRGLMLMIAEVGMGKTTLLYSMLDQLDPQVHTAYLSNTRLSFDDLLRQALTDFGQPCASRDRVDLLNALNAFLHERASVGETAALIIDEAQNLDEATFEDLRLLSNYETYTDKLLQIVLVGQPELDTKLARPSLRQVTERVAVRCHINPLTTAESLRYLEHRLRVAGGSTDVFTPMALRLLVWKARGIPRRLNILCHSAMLFAYGRAARRVSFREARAAIREKQGQGLVTINPRRRFVSAPGAPSEAQPWRIAAAAAAGIAFVLGYGGGYIGGHSDTLAPLAAPTRIIQMNEAAAAPSSGDVAPVAPAVAAPAVETVEAPTPHPAPSPERAAEQIAATAAEPAPEPPTFREIVVPRGTSLSALAQQYYGDGGPKLMQRIRDLNPQIVDVDHIYAGDRLRLPAVDETDGSR